MNEIKKDSDYRGRLVILTSNLENWLKQLNSDFNVPMTNRLAKVVKVFDWSSREGKALLEARNGKYGGKWKNLNAKDFKFVLKIYYPELRMKRTNEVTAEEVLPLYYPGTKGLMFIPLPEWMWDDMNIEEKNAFDLILNEEQKSGVVVKRKSTKKSIKKPVKNKATKKSTKKRTVKR